MRFIYLSYNIKITYYFDEKHINLNSKLNHSIDYRLHCNIRNESSYHDFFHGIKSKLNYKIVVEFIREHRSFCLLVALNLKS